MTDGSPRSSRVGPNEEIGGALGIRPAERGDDDPEDIRLARRIGEESEQAVSDYRAALDAILEAISPGPDDIVVTLGDHVDRGPDSRGVIDRLIHLGQEVNQITFSKPAMSPRCPIKWNVSLFRPNKMGAPDFDVLILYIPLINPK